MPCSRSTLCSAEITFKTDPKNTDYAAEHGASRNFEPWRDEKAVEEEKDLEQQDGHDQDVEKDKAQRSQIEKEIEDEDEREGMNQEKPMGGIGAS